MNKPRTYLVSLLLLLFSVHEVLACPDPPSNDDPCINSVNPPHNLTGGGSHSATTCCARGPQDTNADGSFADYENQECSAATDGAAVWYTFTPNEDDEGYDIILEPGNVEGPISLEYYSGLENGGCNGQLTILGSVCNSANSISKVSNCFSDGEVLFVKVTTDEAEENCGTFTLTIVPVECNGFSNSCSEASDAAVFEVITPGDFEFIYQCMEGCLEYACPSDSAFGGCDEFESAPTVWLRMETDDIAAQLFTTIETNGNWTPVWSIYTGPSCDSLTVVDFGGSPPCSDGDHTPELHQVSVFSDISTYWIAISATDIPSGGIVDGTFELCAATAITAIICLGEEVGDCDDPSLLIEVTDRENEEESLDGPFCPGEEVTIHVTFFYDATESGSDWLIGLIPAFGEGWDMSSFDYAANAPLGNGITAQWYEEGSALAPIIQEDNPILCTYVNANGNLTLCNKLCEPCSDCPKPNIEEGDPLPSGYFWVTNGGNAGCDNDGSPGEGWGIGSTQALIDWEFTLRVKEFEEFEMCFANRDLQINFQTFSDGVAGCWEDPVGECILDRAMFGPAWIADCELPSQISGEDVEICQEGVTDILVQTVDGSVSTIVVDVTDNPFVTGENSYTFESGIGYITDSLVNTSNEIQEVIYFPRVFDELYNCTGLTNKITVTLYPELQVGFNPNFVCENECINVSPYSIGGSGLDLTYAWSDGSTSNEIQLCYNDEQSYEVTVTDASGCFGVAEVKVDTVISLDDCIPDFQYKLVHDFFIDENMNGVRDSLESSFADGSFVIEELDKVIYSLNLGPETLLLEPGDYTIGYNDILEDWILTTDSVITFTLSEEVNCQSIEFGLKPIELNREIKLYSYWNRRCNTFQNFTYILANKGERTESGIMWVEFDPLVLHDDFFDNLEADSIILPNKIGWNFEDLLPSEKIIKNTEIRIPGPPDVDVGWVLKHKIYAELNNSDGAIEEVGRKNLQGNILCGYDPNDKMVQPTGINGYTNIETDELVYTIRFQNTGNDYAEDIEIRDTLSSFFNVKTVNFISSSHTDRLTFTRTDERNLSFYFEDIFLPDSTSNLEGSQGYVIYSVDLSEELPEGTAIDNTAYIYFDANPPIVTNTTQNVLYNDLDDDGYFSIEDCDDENEDINPAQMEIANNDVDEDCDGVALVIDVDEDGFNSDEDCDDDNAEINPMAIEIINNDVDEDCDGIAVVIDIDQDGFNSDDDCDDEDASINPAAEEIENNGIDENCDGVDLIIDIDMDGFNNSVDCDDTNADINPDAEEIPNNDVDEDCDGEALIIDEDEDGFNSDEDCDDDNANVNPDAEEIPNNDVDEDCDGVALVIDEDMDGFNSDEDCDDTNADINPDAEEIINNGVDEDCDGLAIVIDNDQDGYNSDEDCNDENASINPEATEIPNNDVDEDCDGEVLIIDVDMDGFNSDEDCDDSNPGINPDAIEVPNNEVDEDCDGEALIIDEDMDGFNSDEDCDDDNAEIYPGAGEIANNGIDEDCDGEDLIVSSILENTIQINIYPNPTRDEIIVELSDKRGVEYQLMDINGKIIKKGFFIKSKPVLKLRGYANGLYILRIQDENGNLGIKRVVKI